ncbi:MAG: MBL fold metallo-hydrolase [Chloroflexota bacterium]|nr:MBL fold metallo-hydrolase [Chloroflexota bacterium]
MKWTILGSGGCAVIPKPLCRCRICAEAHKKGIPYSRSGPSAFLHDIDLLIDTPAEIAAQLNRSAIRRVDNLLFTHLDPDHVEGFRVVEQIALDFRTWKAHPGKRIRLLLPEQLSDGIRGLRSQYGPLIDFYLDAGFIRLETFRDRIAVGDVIITAVPVERGSRLSFIYAFEEHGKKIVYAPCDIKPFPEDRSELQNADLLIIQPGIFEDGLRHGFRYPADHISRTTLYTFEETMALAERIGASKTVFTHIEEYWNRGYDDYRKLESQHKRIRFAYDGMKLSV